jgi:hypothetical protein
MDKKLKKPPKSVILTEKERKGLEKISYLAHYDSETSENTWPQYHDAFKKWITPIIERNGIEEDEPFFFT